VATEGTKRGGRTAAAKAGPPVRADVWKPRANGTIECTVAGVQFDLRRPLLGEQRRFRDALQENIIAVEREERALPEADRTDGITDEPLLAWWRDVITQLNIKPGGELPTEDEDLPGWLLQGDLVQDTMRVWSSVPWAPGTSPAEQAARQMREIGMNTSDLLRTALATNAPAS
jgi:hypothetical protein